ncbi:MAG: alcohol dehydrogenase catalytic domain-containing protein [Deinococcota bacterium]|jgi:threonine 3-dehydrogenase|nr:alcohol dehydrogenase catalytic domain-containing protein [Deinococcota bacterium]
MRAVVKHRAGFGARLEHLPVPEPGEGEVLVKVKAASICGTDLHLYAWNAWAQATVERVPFIMGHEFSGEVVKAGPGVSEVVPGDYVAGETHIPCGSCYQCDNGLQHICKNLLLFGIHRDGCFADYTLIPALCARRLPRAIPPEIGAMMEPLGTSLRAAQQAGVSGNVAVVIGCGPIGLGIIAAAKAMGAATIVALDIAEERLALATTLGATDVLNPSTKSTVAEIMAMTDGVGADAVIDASGSVEAIRDGFRYLRKGGRVVLVGLPSRPLELDLGADVVFKEATVIGVHGREMFKTWTTTENMLLRGLLDVRPIISHTLPLERFEEGVALLMDGKSSKVMLLP